MSPAVFQLERRQYLPENLLQPEDVAETIVNAIALPDTAEIAEVLVCPAREHSQHFEHSELKQTTTAA